MATREAARKASAEYARRKRAAKVAVKNQGATVCQKGRGRHAICGGVLETVTDGFGRTAILCPLCERRRRGICRDCGLPVAGRVGWAIRCETHTHAAKIAGYRRYQANHRAELRKKARDFYRTDAERREHKNARKRLWRKAHPEKVKQYKRREGLTQNPKRLAYHAKRRERDRLALRGRERARARGVTELRTCLTAGCDIVVTGRKKKCGRCKERQHREAMELLARLQGAA